MSVAELMPILQVLPRVDKLRVLQFLAFELAQEEGLNWFEAEEAYPIWTPYEAFDAADTLLRALETEKEAANVV